MFDFGDLDGEEAGRTAAESPAPAAAATEDDEEAEELRRLEQLRLEEEAARKRREEAEAAARRRREEREREEQRRRAEEEERRKAEEAAAEEERRRKEAEEAAEADRRRKEAEEAAAEEERRSRAAEEEAAAERRRQEEAAAEAAKAPAEAAADGAAAAKAAEKFDELERRLEEEERQGQKPQQAAAAASPEPADRSSERRQAPEATFEAGETVEIQIYVGKWVACKVLGPGGKPNSFSVHILPTEMYDCAAGRSDKDVPDVPGEHLRKAPAAGSAEAGDGGDGDAAPAGGEASSAPAPTAAVAAAEAPAVAAEASKDAAGAAEADARPPEGSGVAAEAPAPEGAGAAAPEAAAVDGADVSTCADGEAAGQNGATPADAESKEAGDLVEGSRVVIKDLTDKHAHLNGITATLVEKKWKGNWICDLDDEEGRKRRLRRRWLLNENNLEVTAKKAVQKYNRDLGRPKLQYFVVGTWNDNVPRRMTWDHDRLCWTFEVRVGQMGQEAFQIWLERDKKKCVHPDTVNAGNYVPWELEGPDDKGEKKKWLIGSSREGERFELRLFLWEDEMPQCVEWSVAEAPGAKKPAEAGAKEAKKCPRGHDLKVFKPPVDGYSCSKCRKAFPKGATFFSCRPCDYDECEPCSKAQAEQPNEKAAATNGAGSNSVAEEAKKFLEENEKKGASADDARKKDEVLKVGDRVTITSVGPYRGKQGTVMKVDEDGDPAVRLESGEAKLFYRIDVAKVAGSDAPTPTPTPSRVQASPTPGISPYAGLGGLGGKGKGKAQPANGYRPPSSLGFGVR